MTTIEITKTVRSGDSTVTTIAKVTLDGYWCGEPDGLPTPEDIRGIAIAKMALDEDFRTQQILGADGKPSLNVCANPT